MKLAAMSLVVLCAAPFLGAQSLTKPATTGSLETIKIDSVEATMAYRPGMVEIRGENLDWIRGALINGIAVPILRGTGTRMWIRPGLQDPGIAKLELTFKGGAIQLPVEFMPTLQAWGSKDGIRVALHGGEPGPYWLYYSVELATVPVPHPGIYYYEMLDLSTRYSGLLAKGTSDGRPLELFVPVPADVALIHPLHVQALCLYPGPYLDGWSYSNASTMP